MIRRGGFVTVAALTMNQTTTPWFPNKPVTRKHRDMSIDLRDPKQAEVFNRRINRQLAKQGREGYEDSIKNLQLISEGDLYPKNPLYIELLKEIEILSPRADLMDGDKPRGREKINYQGWCYMGQEKLAGRVRRNEKAVCRALNQMARDGVIKKRTYWTSPKGIVYRPTGNANKHCEYMLVREVLLKHWKSAKASNDKSDGGSRLPEDTNVVASEHQVSNLRTPTTPFPVTSGHQVSDAMLPDSDRDSDAVGGRDANAVLMTATPSASPRRQPDEGQSLRSKEQKPKSKAIGVGGLGVGSSLPESKPTKNPAVYLDNEPDEGAGRNPIPPSAAPDAYCSRCGGENGKHVSEPGMVCPVLKAKAAAAPRVFDVEEA